MRRLNLPLVVVWAALLAACTGAPDSQSDTTAPPPVPPPPYENVADWCPAGPDHQLPPGQDVRVRMVQVLRLPDSASNGVRVIACIDAAYPAQHGSIKAALFRRNGRFVTSVGQPTAARPSGSTFTYAFGSEAHKDALAAAPFADIVVLQMFFDGLGASVAPAAPTTITIAQRAAFVGLPALRPGLLAADSCLAPARGDRPEARDVTVALRGTRVEHYGCIVARRMAGGALVARLLTGTPGVNVPFSAATGAGNGIDALAPLRGLPGRPSRTIALLAADVAAAPPVYPIVPVEVTARLCQEAHGPGCTPRPPVTQVIIVPLTSR